MTFKSVMILTPDRARERPRPRPPLAACAAAVTLLTLPGCYERVVRDGHFAPAGDRYEPNLNKSASESPLDAVGDLIFGPVETQKRGR